MAFAPSTQLSGVRSAVTAGQGRPRPFVRVGVCASLGAVPEQGPAPSRRTAVLLGLSPLLLSSAPAWSAYVQLQDSRASGAKELMLSQDQARDDQLDERRRFAFESVDKMSPEQHRARAKVSYGRLQRDVKTYLDKKLLNRVSNELGLQMGYLRYDLERATAGDSASRKKAQAESKQAIKALEKLDLYARLNKPSEANEAYADAMQKLGSIVKAYG